MRFPVKLAIGSISAFIFIILVGFVLFPRMITSKVKGMVNLAPGNEIRDMFIKVPFALSFKIYLFNVTNPMEIQSGEKPIVKEVGPFCYEEWKEKMNIEDKEEDDTISYNQKDTYLKKWWPGCRNGQEEVTIPHPLILGIVNTVARQKPGALSLINKAIKSIYSDPSSIFLTAKVDDILFDGVVINCNVSDFAGKALCGQLRTAEALTKVGEVEKFSLFSSKNATLQKRIKAYRGKKNHRDVGRIVEYNSSKMMDVWPTEECNSIEGTDGTIFPPLTKPGEGLFMFSPDLCRSLIAFFVRKSTYDGIPCGEFTADLGDMSKNEKEKCYCSTPETCLKKGMMDLYKCSGIPIYASFPHFYNSDTSYLKGVGGLSPNKTKHEIKILFESITGSPLYARKRLQFSMPLESTQKVELFKNFTGTVLPIFWIEEGVGLNRTYTGQLKSLFTLTKVVKVSKWLILIGSLGGLAAAGYLFFKVDGRADITPVHEIRRHESKSGSTVNGAGGHVLSGNGLEKY
uniref:Sensory neuron membrane protein SNMP1a n=1 Tax=Colaphellus bowringi TaxID=561076 RepID=A0A0S3J446_9CUCU|nr:sensory neuron membrane protein SNMP1a [Colaphellus bowringi]